MSASKLEKHVSAWRLGPPRGIDRLKQRGIDGLHPRQQPDHSGVCPPASRPDNGQVETRDIERQRAGIGIDRRQPREVR